MQILKNTVVTLDYKVTDSEGNLIDDGKNPLVYFCIPRQKNGRYVIAFDPPIAWREDQPRNEEIARLTARYMERMEEMVRQAPEQYWWFHRRWKTTPESVRKRGRNGSTAASVEAPQPTV